MSQLVRAREPRNCLVYPVLIGLISLVTPLAATAQDSKPWRLQIVDLAHQSDAGRKGLATDWKVRQSEELAGIFHSTQQFGFGARASDCQLAIDAGVDQSMSGVLKANDRNWLDLSVRNRQRLHIIAGNPASDRASLKAIAALAGQARKHSVKLWSIIRQAKRAHPSGRVTVNLEYRAVAHSREYVALRRIYRRFFRIVRARERAISARTDYTHWYSSLAVSARKCQSRARGEFGSVD